MSVQPSREFKKSYNIARMKRQEVPEISNRQFAETDPGFKAACE